MSSLVVDGFEIPNAQQLVSIASGIRQYSEDFPGTECFGCTWSRNRDYFAWSCGLRKIKVVKWDLLKFLPNNELDQSHIITIDAGGYVHSLAFCTRQSNWKGAGIRRESDLLPSRKDVTLAAGMKNGRIRAWDAKTGVQKMELCDHIDVVTGLSFAPRGPPLLVSCSLDATVKLWDLDDDGNLLKTFRMNGIKFNYCAWSPDGVTMATVGDKQSVFLWDMKLKRFHRRLDGHRNVVTKCHFSPDGALLATSSYDSRVIIWNVQTGEQIRALEHCDPPLSAIYAGGANNASVKSVSFSKDGYHVATVCEDGFVRFWNIFEGEVPTIVLALNVEDAVVCNFAPGGSMLAVGTCTGDVRILKSPIRVATLQHLCRIEICRIMCTAQVDLLHYMPPRLQKYLQYSKHYPQTSPILGVYG